MHRKEKNANNIEIFKSERRLVRPYWLNVKTMYDETRAVVCSVRLCARHKNEESTLMCRARRKCDRRSNIAVLELSLSLGVRSLCATVWVNSSVSFSQLDEIRTMAARRETKQSERANDSRECGLYLPKQIKYVCVSEWQRNRCMHHRLPTGCCCCLCCCWIRQQIKTLESRKLSICMRHASAFDTFNIPIDNVAFVGCICKSVASHQTANYFWIEQIANIHSPRNTKQATSRRLSGKIRVKRGQSARWSLPTESGLSSLRASITLRNPSNGFDVVGCCQPLFGWLVGRSLVWIARAAT